MRHFADVIAYDPDGQIALIAEAKSRTDTSRKWATQMRRNIVAHGVMPNSPYFLLALPDRFYLWKDAGNTPDLIEPTYELPAQPFLGPYYEKAQISPADLSPQSFELIVASWLNELTQWGIPAGVSEEQQKPLRDSGLVDLLKGGSIVREPAS